MGSGFAGAFFLFNCYWSIDHPVRLTSLQSLNIIPPLGHFTEAGLTKSLERASCWPRVPHNMSCHMQWLSGLKQGLLQGPECHPSWWPVCLAFGTGAEGG